MEAERVLESLQFVLKHHTEFVELQPTSGYVIDLRYASKLNFVGENMYGPFNRAFLHNIAAAKLDVALAHMRRTNPQYKFIIYDALRPRCIQRVLWSHVVGTPEEIYVANPDRGSMHNYGMAVDLSVLDENGEVLDMGAGFDDFREIAQPEQEARFIAEGLLTEQHMRNRLILREAMQAGGYSSIRHEWWHFEALPRTEVRERFTIVE